MAPVSAEFGIPVRLNRMPVKRLVRSALLAVATLVAATAFAADTIVFEASSGVDSFTDLTLTKVGSSTVITWGTSDSLTVDGVKPNQLHASDFSFVSTAAVVASAEVSSEAFGSDSHAFEHTTFVHDAPHII